MTISVLLVFAIPLNFLDATQLCFIGRSLLKELILFVSHLGTKESSISGSAQPCKLEKQNVLQLL